MRYRRRRRRSWLDKQYHQNQHVQHSLISAWHIVIGAIVLIVLVVCACA